MPEHPQPQRPTVLRTITASGLDHHVIGIHVTVDPTADPAVDLGGPAEQRDRIRAALTNAVFTWPPGAIALERDDPAGEFGTSADLAIAIALLVATGQAVAWPELADTVIVGELSLDGSIRPCRGVYPAVRTAQAAGMRRVIIPAENLAEARLVAGIEVIAAGESLAWLNSWLVTALDTSGTDAVAETGDVTVETLDRPEDRVPPPWGHEDTGSRAISVSPADLPAIPAHVLRAIGLAAAGGHHMILSHESDVPFAGDAGALLVGLLPPLTAGARQEVLALWSLASALEPDLSAAVDGDPELVTVLPDLLLDRLYGQPDHPARPGYMPLAHHGVLQLVDTARMPGFALDVVAQTMSRRSVVAMSHSPYGRYPADFQLLATTAACPKFHAPCTCQAEARVLHTQHIHNILGADAAINIAATEPAGTVDPDTVPTAEQVATARIRAARRLRPVSGALHTNHTVPADLLREISDDGFADGIHNNLASLASNEVLTGVHIEHIQRLMWTIADYDGITTPGDEQLTEALALHLHAPKPH